MKRLLFTVALLVSAAKAQVSSYQPPRIQSITQITPTGGSAGAFLRYHVMLIHGTDDKPLLATPVYSGPLPSSVSGSVGFDLSHDDMDVAMSVKSSSVIGAYKLESLRINHTAGSTTYNRDGTITHSGYPAAGLASTHSLNFPLADFSVVAPGGQLPPPAGAGAGAKLYPINMSAILTLGAAPIGIGFVLSDDSGGSSGGKAKLLVRAVGPGLARLGAGGAGTDPVLTINTQPEFTIDDWSTNSANAAACEDAANRAGAFPLEQGSKDAAAVIEVPVGPLTVTVRNSGQSGSVLLEVYRVP